MQRAVTTLRSGLAIRRIARRRPPRAIRPSRVTLNTPAGRSTIGETSCGTRVVRLEGVVTRVPSPPLLTSPCSANALHPCGRRPEKLHDTRGRALIFDALISVKRRLTFNEPAH